MQSAIFQSAQRIIAQVLEWMQLTTTSSIVNRISDVFQNGICNGELNSMAIVGKDVDPTLLDFFHVEVQTGVAYINGERAAILGSLITYNASNPSQTTNDGTGNLVPTPQSTGSFNIPLTSGSINYIYLAYLNTIDTAQFTLNDITLAKQFYESTDGYQIIVNITGVNPNSALYILLGQVDLTGTNQAVSSNISIVNRPQFETLANRVGIITNNAGKTDRPSTYAIGSNQYFLDAHIKSVGTGTVSPINAHGLSLNDLGVNPYDNTQFHRIHEHVNGIIAGTPVTPYPITSALYPQVVHVFPGPPDDYIVVQPLKTNIVGGFNVEEVVVLNGIAYTPLELGNPAGYTITFTGNPPGTYFIYFDGTNFTITQTSIVNDETKLFLGTVTYSIVGTHGTLSAVTDNRQFGTLDTFERWVAPGGRPQNPIAGQFGYDLNTNLMEYYNGTVWTQPITNLNNSPVPTGSLLPFGGSSAPGGFLLCDGTSYPTATYPALFGTIGYSYGGSGANFNVPDTRGRFLRGVSGASGNDPDSSSRFAITAGGATGNNVGSYQNGATARPNITFTTTSSGPGSFTGSGTGTTDTSGAHKHSYATLARTDGNETGSNGCLWSPDTDALYYTGNTPSNPGNGGSNEGAHSHNVTVSVSGSGTVNTTGTVSGGGDDETRPINVYVNYIIKI